MSKEKSVKGNVLFSGKVKANSTGYYKGRVIKEGQSFQLDCELIGGKFPQWVEVPADYKAPKVYETPFEKKELKSNEIV